MSPEVHPRASRTRSGYLFFLLFSTPFRFTNTLIHLLSVANSPSLGTLKLKNGEIQLPIIPIHLKIEEHENIYTKTPQGQQCYKRVKSRS